MKDLDAMLSCFPCVRVGKRGNNDPVFIHSFVSEPLT